MRTNIEIDDEVMKEALTRSGLRTKKAVVDEALKLFIRLQRQKDLLALAGKVKWEGDLDQMRQNRFPDWS
jgi:Arc/MetJ family transcription regulator